MPDPISLTILGAVADAVFSYVLERTSPVDQVRAWLGREPARLAFQTALACAYSAFADQHPRWATALLDETYLTRKDVTAELAKFLTRRDAPDPNVLARAWAEQLPHVGERHREDVARALADFLRELKRELENQEALRAIHDSRALERIAANTEALMEELRRLRDAALAAANRSVRIAGDIHNALIVTGDHNTIQYFVAPVRTLPTDYAGRVENFLHEYLGTPELPVPFGGREAELRALSAWLEDEDAPPYLLLTAPAGKGKSALLVRWAAGLRAREDVAAVFVPVSIRFNTNLYGVTFAILAAQLAQVYGKKPPEKDETPEMWRAFVTETLKEPPPDGKRVVVVVDGLDEAADWTPGADMFPYRPGERVRVVVSARLTAIHSAPEDWLRTLNWGHSGLARAMELTGLSREGVADVLIQMGFPLNKLGRNVDIVAELYRLTEGDPLLVRLYVDDLWARGEEAGRLRPEDLRNIEPGYKGYFEKWWEDQRNLWGKEAPLKEQAVREVLNLLACALGPLTQEDLLALANEKADLDPWTLEEALRPVERFVVGNREQGYILAHPKLGEYFRDEVLGERAVRRIEGRFIAWSLDVLSQLEAGGLAVKDVPPYPLHYLSVHLAQAHRWDDLRRLVESPAWYRTSTYVDPSGHLFAADVERGLEWADAQVLRHDNLHALPHVVAWSLLYATVRTRATHVPVEALEAMVLLGEGERALRYADLITDQKTQSIAYLRIAWRLGEMALSKQATQILQKLFDKIQKVNQRNRIDLLVYWAQLSIHLRDDKIDQALSIICKSTESEVYEFAAREFAQQGLSTQLRELEECVNQKPCSELCKVLFSLGVAQGSQRIKTRKKYLDMAYAAVPSIQHKVQKTKILLALAEEFRSIDDLSKAKKVLREAFDSAQHINEKSVEYIESLSFLAIGFCRLGNSDEALSLLYLASKELRSIKRIWYRSRALYFMVQAYAELNLKKKIYQIIQNEPLAYQHSVLDLSNPLPSGVLEALVKLQDLEGIRIFQKQYEIAKVNDIRTLSLLARSFALLGRHSEARKILKQVIEKASDVAFSEAGTFAVVRIANELIKREYKDKGKAALIYAKDSLLRTFDNEIMAIHVLINIARSFYNLGDSALTDQVLDLAKQLTTVILQSGNVDDVMSLPGVAAKFLSFEGNEDFVLLIVEKVLSEISYLRVISKPQADKLVFVLNKVKGKSGINRLHRLALFLLKSGSIYTATILLSAITPFYVRSGKQEIIFGSLMQAREAIKRMVYEADRCSALSCLAVAFVFMGKKDEAKSAVRQALNIVLSFNDTYMVTIPVKHVIASLSVVQDRNALRLICDKYAQSEFEPFRSEILYEIVRLILSWNVGIGEAKQIYSVVGDAKYRALALTEMAFYVGDYGIKRGMLEDAMKLAWGVRNANDRRSVIDSIAGLMAKSTSLDNVEMAKMMVRILQKIRIYGRDDLWQCVDSFAEVLGKLEVIWETWKHIQQVEKVVFGNGG